SLNWNDRPARSRMKRRLRIAATAFGAFLVPACVTPPEPKASSPKVASPTAVKSATGPALAGKWPRSTEKFADGRTETTSAFAQAPKPAVDVPIATTPITKVESPSVAPVAAESAAQNLAIAPRVTATATPTTRETPRPEPVPDA